MKITIMVENDSSENDLELFLDNESLDNSNFIDLTVEEKTYSVPVEEFFKGVEVFEKIRKENLKNL